jgi:hypothetical protein
MVRVSRTNITVQEVAAIDLNVQGGSGEPPYLGRPRLRMRGLDVHEHVRNARVALLDRSLYPMGDLVTLVDGNVSVHTNV